QLRINTGHRLDSCLVLWATILWLKRKQPERDRKPTVDTNFTAREQRESHILRLVGAFRT
ncbi:MAG TPA: hypothetical protein VMT08_06735, partial [Bradyrhizobium sp.]|nr:hypothetical protein [Bradyrhizobium sp.]